MRKYQQNEQGIAILMIMTSISLLAFLLAEFTYDTKLNKIKIYNLQDKFQARLNAESGLKFAMAKLKIYKEARNIYEKNTNNVQSYISADKLENISTQPIYFPIEGALLQNANILQKQAILEFSKSVILKGKLSVFITPVNGLINVNNLRVPKVDPKANPDDNQNTQDPNPPNSPDTNEQDKNKKATDAFIEDELRKVLEARIQEKRESDEFFEMLYGNVNANLLVKELKFYVNTPSKFTDSEKGELENLYSTQNITPKHAPMASISEMHLLAGWKDEILKLVINELTVHSASIIPLNKITGPQLKMLFSNITNEQIKEFFIYRDGGKDDDQDISSTPHPLKTLEEFKNLIVDKLQVTDGGAFDLRIKEFKNAGIIFGGAGKLFKITSTGEYGRSNVTLEAYVDLPIKPELKKPKSGTNKADDSIPDTGTPDKNSDSNGVSTTNDGNNSSGDDKNKDKSIMQFFPPRVIEIELI